MAKLRQNIWFLFLLLFAGSCLLLAFFLHQRWQLVVQEHTQHQHTQVQQLVSSVKSLLSIQGVLANLYHDQLVDLVLAEHPDSDQGSRLLDHLLQNNRFATAYGVARPDGYLVMTSSNRTIDALGNLRRYSYDHGVFEQAMHTKELVLGRTYFIEPLNLWAFPVRKSLRTLDGHVVAIMALGVSLHNELDAFIEPLLLPNKNNVALIRQHDGYYQFFAGEAENPAERYETAIALTVLQQLQSQLNSASGLNLQQLRQSEEALSIQLALPEGRVQAVIRYLPEYELWAVSQLHSQVMQQAFWHSSWRYLLVFMVSQLLLFLLIRTIAQADRTRSAELRYEATHDQLTGLPNRNFIRQHRNQLLRQPDAGCYLLFLDLDNFKTINDSFGHELGDAVLKEVAHRLKCHASNASTIVRHGGDEFLLFLPALSEPAVTAQAAQLIQELSRPYQVDKLSFVIGASIGMAHYPTDASQLNGLIRAADVAMYEAKKTKNHVFLYDKELDQHYQRRFSIEQRLRTAIEQHHLFMVYQPQIDSKDLLYGVEALVRWQDPMDGFIPPDQFIQVAEESGQMPVLGAFIMQQALSEIRALQLKLGVSFQLSINISVRQLLQTDFVQQLERQLDQSGIKPTSLTLELTESILIEDHQHICQLLQQIKQLGCKVSMDDFGTGYSSLSMLRTLPVDELKIDKSFVDCMRDDETCRNMTASIIAIGQRMKLLTIAEGVEHGYERDLLLQMGCELYQGYFFAKPMPAAQLLDYLQSNAQRLAGTKLNPEQ